MGLDVAGTPIVGQTIKYIRAAYDFTRDGGGTTQRLSIPSQQIPNGALVIAAGYQVIDPFTDEGTSTLTIYIGDIQLEDAFDMAGGLARFSALDMAAFQLLQGALPLSVQIGGDGYSAGSAYLYVFYI
jgi:hypothetical protein